MTSQKDKDTYQGEPDSQHSYVSDEEYAAFKAKRLDAMHEIKSRKMLDGRCCPMCSGVKLVVQTVDGEALCQECKHGFNLYEEKEQ